MAADPLVSAPVLGAAAVAAASAAASAPVPAPVPRPGPPLWLLLELTYRCPLHCAFCYNPTDFAGMNDEYATWFPAEPPTRYVSKLGVEISGVLVSIRMTAFLG